MSSFVALVSFLVLCMFSKSIFRNSFQSNFSFRSFSFCFVRMHFFKLRRWTLNVLSNDAEQDFSGTIDPWLVSFIKHNHNQNVIKVRTREIAFQSLRGLLFWLISVDGLMCSCQLEIWMWEYIFTFLSYHWYVHRKLDKFHLYWISDML